MYSCGLFTSDVDFEDFKRQLERLNISLKSEKFNMTHKRKEFKQKILALTEEKKENLLFYYYASINLILQNLLKSKTKLRINKKYKTADSELKTIEELLEDISVANIIQFQGFFLFFVL